MAIEFDSSTTNTSYGTSASFSHTAPSGDNRILLVFVGHWFPDGTRYVSSITYGGQALTIVNNVGAVNGRLWFAYLVDPPTGANTLVVSIAGGAATYLTTMALNYTGVDVADPLGAYVESTFTATSVSNNLASEEGQVVVDCAHKQDTTDPGTPGAGQTSRAGPQSGGSGSGRPACECSEEAGATTVTMSWSGMPATRGNHIAQALRPAIEGIGRTIKYRADVYEEPFVIRDEANAIVRGYEVMPNNWIRSLGILRPTSKDPDSLVEDPGVAFIEEVQWSQDGDSTRIISSRQDLPEISLRRAAQGSTG